MIHVLKTLLIWLIIAALPLQGVAAVRKQSCGPQHHSAVQVASAQHHDQEMNAQYHDHAAADSHVIHTASDAKSEAASSVKSSYCSACVACCVGASAPPTELRFPVASLQPQTLLPSPKSWLVGFIPSSLERPPKSISA